MKNIHILPTEVFNQMPYQIWRNKDGGLWRPTKEFPINSNLNGKVNIYITSDEEIREGDYVIEDYGGIVYGPINRESIVKNPKKIILTTDQDLIKDGVQAVEEDFLNWFVDNPSCEWVEVEEIYTKVDLLEYKTEYKIIIPFEDRLKLLLKKWQERQLKYQDIAQTAKDEHNDRKFTYKAMATRDCWKELLKLIEDEK